MKEIILVNGKTPNVSTLKDVIKSNPNAKIGFTGMGNNSILKFLKENNIENKNCLYYKGFSKKTKEEKIDAITKKGFEIIAEVGTDDIIIKKEVKKVPYFETEAEAKKVASKLSIQLGNDLFMSFNYFSKLVKDLGGVPSQRGGLYYARLYFNEGKNYIRVRY
jgi:hypothetical protein